ncbi:dynein regulatory complex protein 10-like isoform X1 [Pieris napi]|uniref:dynein regulatory complex protein 10-like isoform X1 n=1 Tax=Pieris napi TaxID=78633 RepID=UPI001FB991D2|nr:dynein regulatory complex protein 10-like isoform X1 [Pieris napi]
METQSSGTLQSPSTFSESSKTGSSRSVGSAKDEPDFTKDNSASPIDLECHIQAERITKILDETIYKTKMALCLPHLVQEYKTLSSILSNQHMEDLVFIFEQYDNPLFSTSLLNLDALEDIKAGDVSLKNRLNPELGHLVYILNSYPHLKPKVEEMITEMKEEYSAYDESRRRFPGLEYLLTLEHFRDLMIKQMDTTAAEELAAKLNTRKLEGSNERLIEKIKEYTQDLKEENERFEETMRMKTDLIARLEQEIAILNRDAEIRLKKKILDSDRQMVLATRAHLVKNEMLKEEEVECRELYENILRKHLIDEKNQRARRFKVETQLLSWLQKYDLEMADKQVELDEFTTKYEEEVQKCDDLELKLAEQDKEYIPLMAEREEEYHQELTEKMNKFLLEHAARVIQCAWRDVLANRAEKKRLKKLQKKMQAAQAAAEAAEKKKGKK